MTDRFAGRKYGYRANVIIPRGGASGHSEQLRTDVDLQLGPPPDKIERLVTVSRGKVGPNVNTFPMTGGMQFVGHVPLVQIRRGPTLNPGNAIDDRASIPAIYAGNPVE